MARKSRLDVSRKKSSNLQVVILEEDEESKDMSKNEL